MNFKKRVNGSWADIPYYVHDTDTDAITTLPADIYANDTTATVGLKGNMEQSGTPTHDNPVMPNGTGERTGNLAPPLLEWVNGYIASNGTIAGPRETYKEKSSDYILIDAGKTYTFSMENGFPGGTYYSWRAIGWYAQDKTFISRASGNANVALSTNAPSNAVYCRLSYRTHGKTTNPMLNTGSTPLPYEPYGYKIPISSANTTTPVYLGEVETTREIRRLVLTGEERYNLQSINTYGIANFYYYLDTSTQAAICTHLKRQVTIISQTTDEGYLLTAASKPGQLSTFYMRISSSKASTVAELKSYLAAQYAAGTPVTVWYVLAEPTTGIVNEPLMKIGDYADEVSGITIPTIAGANTLSIGTTLQPSEVSVNYKGWHPVQSVHEAENGAWT